LCSTPTGFNKTGNGSLKLTGASTYGAGTLIGNGSIILSGGDNRLPVGTTVVLGSGANSAQLVLGDSSGAVNQTVASLQTNGTGTANAVVGGASSVSTLTINAATSGTYSGLLGGTGPNQNNLALTMSGTGTLTLSAANTYTGLTSITSTGTLIASGAINGGAKVTGGGTLVASGGITGDVSVQGGTLGGMATISGSVTIGTPVASGSTSIFYPGISGTATNQGRTTGNLTLNSDAIFKFNINSDLGDSVSTADLLTVNGTLTLNNHPVLQGFDLGSSLLAEGTHYPIACASGGIRGTGTFATLDGGDILQIGGNYFSIDYTYGGGNYISLMVVPEPQTWAMMIGGLGMLGFWQRASRRRNS
jgi:autotransporter-associated beta strand protein